MTSAFSAVFGNMVGGTVNPGGISWWAIVQETFSLAFAPGLSFTGTGPPTAITVTPQIGMLPQSNGTAAFQMNLTPKFGSATPGPHLFFTPQINIPATYTYGPEHVSLVFALAIAMGTSPWQLGKKYGVAIQRAATI